MMLEFEKRRVYDIRLVNIEVQRTGGWVMNLFEVLKRPRAQAKTQIYENWWSKHSDINWDESVFASMIWGRKTQKYRTDILKLIVWERNVRDLWEKTKELNQLAGLNLRE